LDTVLALTLRGGAEEELTKILREDPSISALVPFLASSLMNAPRWTRGSDGSPQWKKHQAERTRIARLAGSGWLANPHIREDVMPYLPRLIMALRQLASMATPPDMREILGYAAAVWD
jgi:hypothetical protein